MRWPFRTHENYWLGENIASSAASIQTSSRITNAHSPVCSALMPKIAEPTAIKVRYFKPRLLRCPLVSKTKAIKIQSIPIKDAKLVMGSRLEKAMVESVIDSLSQSLLNYISAEN